MSCRFGRLEEARGAIRLLSPLKVALDGAKRWNAAAGKSEKDYRDVGPGELALDSLETVPMSAVRSFAVVYTKVVASHPGTYTWEKAADEFTF